MIQASGYVGAKIMLIADGGAEEDIMSGYALSGQQEKTLKGFCQDHHIRWTDVWKTALIKERINLKKPKDNADNFLQDPKWYDILQNEIQQIKPNVIVPLSELSFHYTTGLQGIRKFRGSVLPASLTYLSKPTRVIPILGPNPYLNEDPKMNFITRLDFGKVARNQDLQEPIKEVGNCWVAKTAGQFREFLERQWLAKPVKLVFDIETFCGIPTCVSFCFDGEESVTAPLVDYKISFDDRVLMARLVSQVLALPIPKVNQNIKFDWRKFERFGFVVNNVSGDTLLAASCLYCEFPKNLGFLTSLYTDMPYFKDEGKQFDPSVHNRDKLYLYCAKDSLATFKIHTQQVEEIKELGVSIPYNNLIRILPIYKRAEERGIRIDQEQRQRLYCKYKTLFDMQVFKARLLTNNEKFNPLSDDQVRKVVYEELGFKWIKGVKKTKTGKNSTDEDSLEILMWKGQSNRYNSDIFLKCFINCRKLHKVLEYIQTPIHPDSRMRSEFNLAGAETGRTTASETTDNLMVIKKEYSTRGVNAKLREIKSHKIYIENLGRSFQTIAKHGFEIDGEYLGKDLRSMFVPSPGYGFIEADLNGAEARVDAILASDYDILPVFDNGSGIHRLTGSWIWDCDPKEIKKNILVDGVERYYVAKTTRHAAERNMREDRLMVMIHRPISECRMILNKIHDRQPNIRGVFHKDVYNQIYEHRLLVAPNGRRRDFFGRFDHHMVNEGISFLPQTIVTDYLKAAVGPTFESLSYAEMLSEAHDGLLAEVPIGKEKEYASTFKKNVEVPIDFNKCSLKRDYQLTIPCEVEWSKENWMEMEPLEL